MIGRGNVAWSSFPKIRIAGGVCDWALQVTRETSSTWLLNKGHRCRLGHLLLVPVKKGGGGREGHGMSVVGSKEAKAMGMSMCLPLC